MTTARTSAMPNPCRLLAAAVAALALALGLAAALAA